MAEVLAKAAAARASSGGNVIWSASKTYEVVADKFDMTISHAIDLILDELCRLDVSCFCETVTAQAPPADVYSHDWRGCEWYVKVALSPAPARQLTVISFHPAERRMRRVTMRVRYER